MSASCSNSPRIRIKKSEIKAQLGYLQRSVFHPLSPFLCSHPMSNSMANHVRCRFNTHPESGAPPLLTSGLTTTSALENYCHGCSGVQASPLCVPPVTFYSAARTSSLCSKVTLFKKSSLSPLINQRPPTFIL